MCGSRRLGGARAAASKLFLQTRYSLRRVDGFDATVTVTLIF
jgi:hypothetical protein